jgi:hypothetical protein
MSDAPAPTNVRFTVIGDGLTTELISNQVQFFYDPTTNEARAIFNSSAYLPVAGSYLAITGTHDVLNVDFTSQFERCYAADSPTPVLDPVTGADLTKVSVIGIMSLIKIAFDKEANAREAARLAGIAAAEAAAAEAAAIAAETAQNAQPSTPDTTQPST